MKLPRLSFNPNIILPLVALLLVLSVIFPRQAKFSYDYRKGSPWGYETLVAQFDFPILKTDEQMREDRSHNKSVVVPYYRFRSEAVENGMKSLERVDFGRYSSLRPAVISAMDAIWSNGVVPDEGVKLDSRGEDKFNAVLYIQKDKRAVKKPVSEVYRESDAKGKLLSEVSAKVANVNVDSVLRSSGVYDILVPSLEYDARTTELVNSESASQISTTQGFVSAGQLIVSEGEIVTAEIAQMLDSYKVEYEQNLGYGGPKLVFWLGNLMIAFVIVVLLFLVIYFLNKNIFMTRNKYLYLVFIVLFTSVLTLVFRRMTPKFMYLAPFTLTALYLEAFFKNKIILPICCVAFIPMLIFSSNGVVLFVMFLVASQVAVFSFKYFRKGWQQFITAAVVFVSLVITYFSFRMIDMVNDNPYEATLFLFIGSLLTVAGYTLILLFERLFNLLSNTRLNELCDTNNALLRELEHKAPGTFQHSLQVMNMADAAARSIDANTALVRAGALYHDLGKMNNPLCFIENDSMSPGGAHYHDGKSFKESASAITRHVTDGIAIAKAHNLPDMVCDFIRTHHGTTCTGYFYTKYIQGGGDPDDVSAFFYNGIKPQTKEQIILMICDTIEAASRTLKDYSPDTFSKFVESLVASKMQAGQFDEADISIKEICTVKEVLKGYLSQIYHERIVYPTQKINNNR
jgi:uncharacterized domain HDIG